MEMFGLKIVTLKLNNMKNSILKFSLAVFLSIVLIGCSSDEPDIQIVETVGQEEAKRTAQVDNATEVK